MYLLSCSKYRDYQIKLVRPDVFSLSNVDL